jgi:hypothetical protein
MNRPMALVRSLTLRKVPGRMLYRSNIELLGLSWGYAAW